MQSTAGYYGHVAVVEQVYKNGSIKVSEYNFYRPLKYNTRVLSKRQHVTLTIFTNQKLLSRTLQFPVCVIEVFIFVHINLFKRYDGLT